MPWQQLATVRHQFAATGVVALEDDLPAEPARTVRSSARFTIANRGAASAYLVVAADLVGGGVAATAFEIPAGTTRVSPDIDWPAPGEYPQLRGLITADCFVTPEVRVVP
jgi:hypothetical protein